MKSSAWEIPVLQEIERKREVELKHLFRFNIYKAVTAPIAVTIPTLASVLTFFCYSFSVTEIDVAKAFSVVAMFAVIRPPFVMFPMGLNMWV